MVRARGAGRRPSFALAYRLAAQRFYETRGGYVKTNTAVWVLGFANRLTEDAADEAGVIQVAKVPAPGAPIAKQLLTRAPNPMPASSPTQTFPLPSTRNLRASCRWLCYSLPDMMPSKVTSPNASFSLLVLFTLAFAVRQYRPDLLRRRRRSQQSILRCRRHCRARRLCLIQLTLPFAL